jgi:hypothetical protein
MQNEGLGRTTPRERKKNKNKKKVGDTLHHWGVLADWESPKMRPG